MTAAAAPEIRAAGRDAVRRGIEHFERPRANQARLLLRNFGADALAGQNVRRQNDAALLASPRKASEAIATVDQLLDRQFEIAYDRDLTPQTGQEACPLGRRLAGPGACPTTI